MGMESAGVDPGAGVAEGDGGAWRLHVGFIVGCLDVDAIAAVGFEHFEVVGGVAADKAVGAAACLAGGDNQVVAVGALKRSSSVTGKPSIFRV